MNKNRLLILACSATKNPTPGELPAVDRYRPGAYYQMLHQVPRRQWPDIIVLSAPFGFIAGSRPIPDYDQRMTPQRARQLRLNPETELALADLLHPGYQDIFVAAGRAYREVIHAFSDSFPASATILTATGGIGKQRQQLKRWLALGPQQEGKYERRERKNQRDGPGRGL